ncbi:NUDIX hydrolase [Candidatus Giovannonibacteria bacterium]|nr:NUDIX hydrolase [Candidatus Giovannonibacteria bacterium]
MTYKIPISVKGVVFEENSVWLRKNQRGEWELPGGKIEEGEQPMETVKREIFEELGFEVEVAKLIHAWIYTVQSSPDEFEGVLVITYLCRLQKKSGSFEIEGESGIAEFAKFKIDEIEKLNMPDFYKKAIELAIEC